ncbi:rCG35444 [Rattus norvegicus]|uniref:RCG35444 n=1 Tax=Rattus norvegicus TaxID=10116 RepID=A6HDE1_RAT|nr:rCG35444 [Rattus norvegicus]
MLPPTCSERLCLCRCPRNCGRSSASVPCPFARTTRSSTEEPEADTSPKFEANLVYRSSSRTARAIERDPVLENQREPENVCLL